MNQIIFWSRFPLLLIFSLILASPSSSVVPLKLVKETRITVEVDILALDDSGTEKLASLSAEIPAGKRGFLAKTLPLQKDGRQDSIGLEIEMIADAKDREKILLEVSSNVWPLKSEEKTEYRRSEKIELNDGSSSLLEIYNSPVIDKKIILNLKASLKDVETFRIAYPSTTKVHFQLNIYRISKGKEILLEQNSLSTLVGQTASYYLHLFAGEKDGKKGKLGEEELDIRMIPLSIADEIVEVEIVLAGRILTSGGKGQPVEIRRVDKVGNSSPHSVLIASDDSSGGDVKEGYRFEIIPSF
ncbi:MAG: hypothetical protein AB1756_07505 [Acidobacteriota bacterium]